MTRRNNNYFQSRASLPQYDSVAFEEYRLQKGDYLDIRVNSMVKDDETLFNNGQRSTRLNGDNAHSRLFLYLVEEDGTIIFPYVGAVPVLGKTLREVKQVLEKSLEDMMNSFSVDVRLANGSFSIIGESGSGRYNIPKERLTIFQALAMSGDLSEYSDRTKIRVIRQTVNGTIVKEFDLRSESIINSEFYYIQPNDVIYVQFSDAKFFGVSHITGLISTILSTISVGMLVWGLVESFK
ncbi:MAG: polysaccharide biosynthesis/export family protein [Bacteroidales bacterium]|nr:polysaccharide biosynthesis/export family protein [Bacteroidales bacterium]